MAERRKSPPREAFVSEYLKVQARKLKEIYIFERRAFERASTGKPSRYVPPCKYDGGFQSGDADKPEGVELPNAWMEAARRLVVQGIDPASYVSAIFSAMVERFTRGPEPSQLTKQCWLDLYEEVHAEDNDDIRLNLVLESDTAKQHVVERMHGYQFTKEEAIESVLLDFDLSLSYLFRYCLAMEAKSERLTDIADRLFAVGAAIQYARDREYYDQHWGKWLPEDFPALAMTVHGILTGDTPPEQTFND